MNGAQPSPTGVHPANVSMAQPQGVAFCHVSVLISGPSSPAVTGSLNAVAGAEETLIIPSCSVDEQSWVCIPNRLLDSTKILVAG